MDTKHIIQMHINAADGQKEELRRTFLAELETLADKAKTAAQHQVGALPTLAWLETSMARLRDLRDAFQQADCAREVLRRVAEAAEFEATRKASA